VSGDRVRDLAQEGGTRRWARGSLAARRLVGAAGVLRRALGAIVEALVPDEDLRARRPQSSFVGEILVGREGEPVTERAAGRHLVVGGAGDADDGRRLAVQRASRGCREEQDGETDEEAATAEEGLRESSHRVCEGSRKHAINTAGS